jgi:hypothetical protein
MKTKENAIALREQGLGYAEIAEQTGYSVDWCKKNLKGVQKNKQEKSVLAEAIRIAQSNDGITNGAIKYLVRGMYPVDGTKEQEDMEKKAIARFKAAINKTDGTLIRPYWMQPENARLSFTKVLSAVDIIQQRMTDEVTQIRKELNLDNSYDNSLRYAIIKMLQGSTLAQEGLENHCDVLNNIANELDKRNNTNDMHHNAPYNILYEKVHSPNAPNFPSVEKCEDVPEWLVKLDEMTLHDY